MNRKLTLTINFSLTILLLNGCNDINANSTLPSQASLQEIEKVSASSSFIIQYKNFVNINMKIDSLKKDKGTLLVTILNAKKKRIQLDSKRSLATIRQILTDDSDIQAFQQNYQRYSTKK